MDRDELVAFAALAKRYIDVSDANKNLQNAAAHKDEPLDPSFINKSIGLRDVVRSTSDFLIDLGYTKEASKLVLPKERAAWVKSKRKEGYVAPIRASEGNTSLIS